MDTTYVDMLFIFKENNSDLKCIDYWEWIF